MRSVALAATLVALALAAGAVPAGAAPRPHHCAPHRYEEVKGRSAHAVVFLRGYYGWAIFGCDRRTGRRRVITVHAYGSQEPDQVRLHGTTVGWHVAGQDLMLDDALHAGRRRTLRSTRDFTSISLFAFGPGGAMAWYEGSNVTADVLLKVPGDVPRLLDEGTELSDLRFTARSLTWRHAVGDRRSVPLAQRDRCPGGRVGGAALTDVLRTPIGAALCLRRSGAVTDLGQADPHAVVLAGRWAAAWAGSRLLAADAATGERRTLTTAGSGGSVTIDEHGSAAWADVTDAPAHTVIHAADAAGRRIAWQGDVAVPFLQHSGSTVVFATSWDVLVMTDQFALAP
jgi:hypothetical protein